MTIFFKISIPKVTIVLCMLVHFFGFSQNPKDDLIAMSKKFSGLKSFDMTVEVKTYKNEFDQSPSFTTKGRTVKSNDKFYLNMLNRVTILNNKIMLVVDEKQKMILYNKISAEQIKALNANQVINIDSLVASNPTEVSYILNSPNEKKISIKSKDENIKSIVVTFNPATYILKEILYLYTNDGKKNTGNSKVVITYSNFLTENISESNFNQSKYIVLGKKIATRKAYKNYRLINVEDYSNK
jgi:hypothetical protein